jgi:UDP-N-acetyl-2-amino-2-deoxyglucuronate dehydrogenase
MKNINFALVGCGRISGKHIEAINDIKNASLVAVCDIDLEKAKIAAGKAGNIPYFASYDEMLKAVPEIDVVNILTPSGMHPEQTIDIVKKYKKHIVCEKPMALRLSDADEMIKTCDENSVRLFVVKQNRYNLPVQKLREAVENDDFGKMVMGTVRVRWCRPQEYYDQADWRGTWEQDGGVITNQASHHIDLLEWMMGEPMSVMAKNGRYLVDIDVDDTCAAIIKFKSGALGIVEATTAARPKDLEGSLSVMGENGSVVIGGFAVNKMETWNFKNISEEASKSVVEKYSELPPNVYGFGHIRYLEHVIDCIINKKKALVDGFEGRKSLELINAIYESAETGKEIFIHFEPKRSKLGGVK